jgi:hypothetical protein
MPKKAKNKVGRGSYRQRQKAAQGGGDDGKGYRRKIRAKKLKEAEKARGCPLTVMILAAPFVAVAVLWILLT